MKDREGSVNVRVFGQRAVGQGRCSPFPSHAFVRNSKIKLSRCSRIQNCLVSGHMLALDVVSYVAVHRRGCRSRAVGDSELNRTCEAPADGIKIVAFESSSGHDSSLVIENYEVFVEDPVNKACELICMERRQQACCVAQPVSKG